MAASRFKQAFTDRLSGWRDFSDKDLAALTDLALAQAQVESADFSSSVFRNYNNAIGYKYYPGSIWQLSAGGMSPEGDRYAEYATVEDSARELADWIHRRASSFAGIDSVS